MQEKEKNIERKWIRNCPNLSDNPRCKKEIVYKYKKNNIANLKNTHCKSCCEYHEKHHKYIKIKVKIFKRKCPWCGKEIIYNNIKSYRRSMKNNKNCKSCSYNYKEISDETRNKMSESQMKRWANLEERKKQSARTTGYNNGMYGKGYLLKGKYNGMYGKKLLDVFIIKYGETQGRIKYNEWFKNRNSGFGFGKNNIAKRLEIREKLSGDKNPAKRPEIREKLRKSIISRIKMLKGKYSPNYNPSACKIIEEYGKKHCYNFQHAENGGEKCIGGYFPDGVDEEKKTIIEIDEKHHFDEDGKLKLKDIDRQIYLEKLGYNIIRIKI